MLLTLLDLAGTAVFAISGAAAGVRHRLDMFGIAVLAFVTASGGGMLRDVLIGAVPPPAISQWQYMTVALASGLVTFWWHPEVERLRRPILLFDAAGLGLFAVAGTQKALGFGLNPLAAAALGMLTGIGGGILRDVLVREIPTVLRADLYAVAALAGAAVVVAGHLLQWPPALTAPAGAALCFGLRVVAIRRRWTLPTAPEAEPTPRA
ncbi:MAG: trimeric intracellular cation channel family protein [Acidobacteriota bacterium]